MGSFSGSDAVEVFLEKTGLVVSFETLGHIRISAYAQSPGELELKNRHPSAVIAFFSIILAALSVNANAQELPQTETMIEEIFVYARKKEESVMDVPSVVNVLTSEQLRANGTTDAQSLALNNVGLVYSVTFAGSAAPRITIRGVGDDDFNPNGSSSAAVHVNGVYQGSNGLLNAQYFDIDRVEILKGPQGTVYGRNATAGAINIVTARPGDAVGGNLDLDAGNFGVLRVEGAVDLPASEAIRFRLAGLVERSDGFFEHLGTGPLGGFTYRPGVIPPQEAIPAAGDWGGADRAVGRVTAELDLAPATLLTLRGTFGKDQSELPLPDVTPELWSEYEDRAFFINPEEPAYVAYQAALDNDPFTTITNALPQMDADQSGLNAQLDHDFSEELTGTILVGYESLDREYTTTDNVPVQAADYRWNNDFSQWTAEARLTNDSSDGLGWVVGAFYLDDELDFGTTLLFRNTGLWQTDTRTDYTQKRASLGLFASLDWSPVEWFTLETGLRYSSDEVSFQGQTTNLDPFATFGPPPTFFPLGSVYIGSPIDPASPLVFNEDLENDKVTWKLGGVARPNDSVSFYATVSTGYKAGGFDGSTILSPQEALPIDPETVTAYEVGAKYQSVGGWFFAEANAFYYDFSDYQSTALLNVGGFDTNVRANVADAVIKGAELSATLSLLQGLDLSAGVALLDTEIENFQGVQDNIEGNDLPFSPDLSWNAAVVYAIPLSAKFTLKAHADISGTGSHFQTVNNNDKVDSYGVANVRLGVETDRWQVALWARNVTDELYDVGFFPGGGLTPDTKFKGDPRTYGVNLKISF